MGYAFVFGYCGLCRKGMTFNPTCVPAIRMKNGAINEEDGLKEPICAGCVQYNQEEQKRLNLPIWPDPHPNAYLSCDENEL